MIFELSERIIHRATEMSLMIATAESCTGGLIAGALTEIAGSSAVVDRGFVTYSNEAKVQMLGVPMQLIDANGAVSDSVVRAMVAGALDNSRADISVAVTGIAGPGGGTVEKPVGLVFIAVQLRDNPPEVRECNFEGQDRAGVREATVRTALEMVLAKIG